MQKCKKHAHSVPLCNTYKPLVTHLHTRETSLASSESEPAVDSQQADNRRVSTASPLGKKAHCQPPGGEEISRDAGARVDGGEVQEVREMVARCGK